MADLQRDVVNAVIYLLIILNLPMLEGRVLGEECPIGFNLAPKGDLCYFLKKGPERFSDKFVDCTGNLFTLKKYNKLDLPLPTGYSLWTDYKSLYPGGPYVDTSDGSDILETTYNVNVSRVSVNDELCVVIDPMNNFTAVHCDEKHYRYCFVEKYSRVRCSELSGGSRFSSPIPTCLLKLKQGRGSVRVTWNQAQDRCERLGATLMGRGWRYFNSFGSLGPAPLNIVTTADHTNLKYYLEDDTKTIPPNDRSDIDMADKDTTLVAINSKGSWFLANSSQVFINPICEKPIELKHVNFTVSVDSSGSIKLKLTYDDPVDDDTELNEEHIKCFTDSSNYCPSTVSFTREPPLNLNEYILKPRLESNGYYWCTHKDYEDYQVAESNKALYIKVKEDTENIYAVKMHVPKYSLAEISESMEEIWIVQLEEYVYFYTSMMNKTDFDLDSYNNHTVLDYRSKLEGTDPKRSTPKSEKLVQKKKPKRLYLDAKTVLLHVTFYPWITPVKPGLWDDIYIEYMKPVYYCNKTTKFSLGMNHTAPKCKLYKCVGDYNNGVDTVIEAEDGCHLPTTAAVSATTNVTDFTPLPTSLPSPPPATPQEQLDQVIQCLEGLLNSTDGILVTDIDTAFTQVDEILLFEELHIPGNLLHLLDDIGARIDLNGSDDSSTVRENIALLVADAQPDLPVKGLRVAVREDGSDVFTNDTFAIIREEINSSQLLVDANEVVVSLPDSVSIVRQRVSFVVFRNDRAFQGGHEFYSVNSRVLSVNVNNVTEFPPGEVIDIYLTPTDEPGRNQSRACAYWQFNEDGTGNWSQAGCTFIRATKAGQLDTCRCDHLTHFAEILVPRTVFSEANESALEILSIIGCCVSILGLLLVGLTAALFRSWRRDYSNKVWLHLCFSILILSICFLIVVFAKFYEDDILCLLTGVALHYSVLASFCWMLVAAVLSYRRLVLVFSRDASHKLLRASAFAWGAPCAVVGILLSVDPHSYAGRFEDKSPSGAFCYPSGLALWLAVYAPIALMLLANWTLFVLIVRSVFGTRRPQNHGHPGANEAFRCASVSCLLVFLFGLPWLFGLFSFNVVAAYFFTILVTFQGFVLFFFFVVGNKKTRDLWLNKMKIKQTQKIPVTSSTYTNRSTGANAPPRANQTPAAIEAKESKPRSMSSSDNSRFS